MTDTWKKLLVNPDTMIIDAMKAIDEAAMQVALVVDEQQRLLGTVTDGDIRRSILKGASLQQSVCTIMHREPTVSYLNESRENMLKLMKQKTLRHIPLVDNNGCVAGLVSLHDLVQPVSSQENAVVLMAGGLGSRLYPMTKECPKPLIKVGSKPILETILENFMNYGFHRFYISVNYKADMIKEYFGDGRRWGVAISYLEEVMPLGTAGPLGLLPSDQSAPVIVMNGDILTRINFQQLLDFHKEHHAMATMCVREYDFQVPYGVVSLEQYNVVGIAEKPVHKFFVNAGIYILDQQILSMIPKNSRCDMPDLLKQVMAAGQQTTAFPIREYWLDIGRMDDLERARQDFCEVF